MSNLKPQSNNLLILQKFILEPLSTIIKLAVLGKKKIGCKISIKNNQIYIQENGVFQGVARYYLGVTKNDIHYLSIPIELACQKYLTVEKIKEIPHIITIFKCAQQGLNNLMVTYCTYPIIVHCLKYYYTIIDSYLHLILCDNSQTKFEKLVNSKKSKVIYRKIDEIVDLNIDIEKIDSNIDKPNEIFDEVISKDADLLSLYTDELLNNLNLIWDKSKIEIVINMIDYLAIEKSAADYAAYIETFMIPIDKETLKIIY